jgi:hypothetical protein
MSFGDVEVGAEEGGEEVGEVPEDELVDEDFVLEGDEMGEFGVEIDFQPGDLHGSELGEEIGDEEGFESLHENVLFGF